MTKLHVFKEVPSRAPKKKLSLLFEAITNEESHSRWSGQVNLVFTTDKRMRTLNRQFRSRDKTTDVLSFNLNDQIADDRIFGEVYISVPTAKRQANYYRTTLTDELLRLACHGLLHLFGYDHVKASEAEKMKAREDYFLEKLR